MFLTDLKLVNSSSSGTVGLIGRTLANLRSADVQFMNKIIEWCVLLCKHNSLPNLTVPQVSSPSTLYVFKFLNMYLHCKYLHCTNSTMTSVWPSKVLADTAAPSVKIIC